MLSVWSAKILDASSAADAAADEKSYAWLGDARTQTIVFAATALVYGVILYYTRRGSQSAALLQVMAELQGPEMRACRRLLFTEATGRPEDWPDDLRSAVEHVCQAYGTVGMLLRARLVPRRAFLGNSGRTIIRCHDAAQPFIAWRAQAFNEPDAWSNFSWLARRARYRWRWRKADRTNHQAWLDNRAAEPGAAGDGAAAD